MTIIVVSLLIFFLNIPFGYWRSNVKKLSVQWFLSIHLPIPVVVFLRIYSEIGFIWYSYPIFIGAFFLGQYAGKQIYLVFSRSKITELSSFIFSDIMKK